MILAATGTFAWLFKNPTDIITYSLKLRKVEAHLPPAPSPSADPKQPLFGAVTKYGRRTCIGGPSTDTYKQPFNYSGSQKN